VLVRTKRWQELIKSSQKSFNITREKNSADTIATELNAGS